MTFFIFWNIRKFFKFSLAKNSKKNFSLSYVYFSFRPIGAAARSFLERFWKLHSKMNIQCFCTVGRRWIFGPEVSFTIFFWVSTIGGRIKTNCELWVVWFSIACTLSNFRSSAWTSTKNVWNRFFLKIRSNRVKFVRFFLIQKWKLFPFIEWGTMWIWAVAPWFRTAGSLVISLSPEFIQLKKFARVAPYIGSREFRFRFHNKLIRGRGKSFANRLLKRYALVKFG